MFTYLSSGDGNPFTLGHIVTLHKPQLTDGKHWKKKGTPKQAVCVAINFSKFQLKTSHLTWAGFTFEWNYPGFNLVCPLRPLLIIVKGRCTIDSVIFVNVARLFLSFSPLNHCFHPHTQLLTRQSILWETSTSSTLEWIHTTRPSVE